MSARCSRDRYADLKSAIALARYRRSRMQDPRPLPFRPRRSFGCRSFPNPDKILCVGLNYETHRKETGRAEVEHPTIFSRYANSQTGHLHPIVRPRVSTDLDFEGELAVIIGKPGRYISRADAMEPCRRLFLLQ